MLIQDLSKTSLKEQEDLLGDESSLPRHKSEGTVQGQFQRFDKNIKSKNTRDQDKSGQIFNWDQDGVVITSPSEVEAKA